MKTLFALLVLFSHGSSHASGIQKLWKIDPAGKALLVAENKAESRDPDTATFVVQLEKDGSFAAAAFAQGRQPEDVRIEVYRYDDTKHSRRGRLIKKDAGVQGNVQGFPMALVNISTTKPEIYLVEIYAEANNWVGGFKIR